MRTLSKKLTGLSLLLPQVSQAQVAVTNPLGSVNDIPSLVSNIITGILGIVGALALFMFVWGGVLWLTSGGNSDRIQKGKYTLVWATLGLFIIFASYGLLRVIIDALTGQA